MWRRVPGNPWFICTLWLAEWYIASARTMDDLERPLQLLNWVADHALTSGVLAEQLHPETGAPLSVSPLTWSHAAFVQTICRYMESRAHPPRARAHQPRHRVGVTSSQ